MKKYPLLMNPCPKEILWGGSKLKEKYNKKADFDKIAESWEVSLFEGSLSTIANGEYCGLTLKEYINATKDSFNLLIKFIDATDKLSVQVHPGDDVLDQQGNSLGKTEIWYIVEADENAEIVYGLKEDTTVNEFTSNVISGNTESCLNYVSVKKGETYFIPAGLVHAIGKGILIAEIQQSSNTTYRLYDYNRKDSNGNLRELHIEKALNVIKPYTLSEIAAIQYSKLKSPDTLSSCDKFTVKRLEIAGNSIILTDDVKSVVIMCTEGSGMLTHNNIEYPIKPGNTYFCPKGLGDVIVTGKLNILTATE